MSAEELYCIKGVTSFGGQRLIEGNIYPLLGTMQCRCGLVNFHVGFVHATEWECTRCTECGAIYFDQIWWLKSSRFVRLSDISITEAVEALEAVPA